VFHPTLTLAFSLVSSKAHDSAGLWSDRLFGFLGVTYWVKKFCEKASALGKQLAYAYPATDQHLVVPIPRSDYQIPSSHQPSHHHQVACDPEP
jgi:hypothetical protein